VLTLVLAPPWVALSTLLVIVVVLEANPQGFLSVGSHFYSAGGKIGLPFMLFLLVVAATLFELVRRGEMVRTPGALTYPLLFLFGTEVLGLVNGHWSGASRGPLVSQAETITELVLMPFLVVNALNGRGAVRNFAVAGAILAIWKGFIGTVGWVMGQGMSFGGTTLTYLEPTANWLMLLLLLTLAVATIHRVPTDRWVRWGSAFAFAALLLSFRRSFWIGAALGFVLVLIFATGRRGGRVLLPTVIIIAIASVVTLVLAGSSNSSNPIVARGKALSPSQISLSADDRYRIEERRNVLHDVLQRPVFGLGIGVPWVANRAISLDFAGARQYTHFLPLWYWMKMGLFGIVAYFWLMVTAMWMGFSIWRQHPDGLHRSIGLAAFAGFAGLMVVETTASFTGVDIRFSILVGAALGWLAAAKATMDEPAPTRTVESGLAQPLAAGRRVVTTGLTRVKVHKAWGVTALALGMVAAGAVALALAISGVAGG
jgi:O-Antigen ligase